MDFPIADLMDDDACYAKLEGLLHPEGLKCPRCGCKDRLGVHHRHRAPVVDYRCKSCGRVFNIFVGTVLEGTRKSPSQLMLILRGFAQGVSTAQLARELKLERTALLEFRHRIQEFASRALDPKPLPDPVAEADEMFQNAGEKRSSARGPRRPAAAARQ